MDLAAGGLSKTERAMLIQLLKKLGTSAGDSAAPRQLEVSHVGTTDSATRP
jgi:MarR family transcriptional regulator, 2-MHQ and catechol-resistance regulon repressor